VGQGRVDPGGTGGGFSVSRIFIFLIQASLDTVDKGAICSGAPPFTLYLAQFLHMEAFELNKKDI